MNLDMKKKYEIIETAITHFTSDAFSIGDLFLVCEYASRNYGLVINLQDILMVVGSLYDNFELNKEINAEGVVYFRNVTQKENLGSR